MISALDWAAIGAVGDVLGGVAVVASLLHVGRQVRHASVVAEVQGIEEFRSKATDFAFTIAAEAELGELGIRARNLGARRHDISIAERARLGYIYFAAPTLQHGLWERERAGLISRQVRDEHLRRSSELLAAPCFRDVWPFMKGSFPPQSCAFVEHSCLAGAPEAPSTHAGLAAGFEPGGAGGTFPGRRRRVRGRVARCSRAGRAGADRNIPPPRRGPE